MLKDIVVYADAQAPATERLDLAAFLARQHDAHLTALHAWAPPYVPFQLGIDTDTVIRWQDDFRREQAAKAKAIVDDAFCRTGVHFDWRLVRADGTAALRQASRVADLLVMTQRADDAAGEWPDLSPTPQEMVMTAACPLLVVPQTYMAPAVGERILIAWKSTRESARAVHDALPLLRNAAAVTVVEVTEESSGKVLDPAADVALHLARHGVSVDVESIAADDRDAGDVLIAQAMRRGADLIVMGAYGHSRFKELVLGGVTRRMLRDMPVPLLMSH